MATSSVRFVSDGFVRPRTEDPQEPIHMAPWELAMLSVGYIQKGLLYIKPRQDGFFMESFLNKLKVSLSAALVPFYPLAGRLKMVRNDDPHFYTVCVDCSHSPGARFIYATLDMTVSEIVDPLHVPAVVRSFFDHNGAVNHDGHTESLFSVQVTELVDGIFIGFSFNHTVVDGTSYWNFLKTWSEIFQTQEINKGLNCNNAIANINPPLLDRYISEGCGIPVNLPFRDPSEFIVRSDQFPAMKERVFHFPAGSVARLKERANEGLGMRKGGADEISSFKALVAFVWISITKARRVPDSRVTSCRMAVNNRSRVRPALPPDYFGNFVTLVKAEATAGELLSSRIGAAAWRLNVAIAKCTAESIDGWHREWLRNPNIYKYGRLFDPFCVGIGSSPRFDMYGEKFGLGKAVAVRSGYDNKFDGKVSAYLGREGGGSVDLEISLSPEIMAALEADAEFMAAVEV